MPVPFDVVHHRNQRDDGEVIDKLTELAEAKPNRGFDRHYRRIRKQGQSGHIERFDRTYREDVLDAHQFRGHRGK